MGKRVVVIRKLGLLFVCVGLLLFWGCECRTKKGSGGKPSAVVIQFVGDLMGHDTNYRYGQFDSIYDRVRPLFEKGEFTVANIEFPLDESKGRSTYPNFNNHSDFLLAAVGAGVNVFSLANNHSADQYLNGVVETKKTVARLAAKYPVHYSGLLEKPGAVSVARFVSREGFSISFIAFTQISNEILGRRLLQMADFRVQSERERMIELVAKESEDVDLVLFSYHCGAEYNIFPVAAETQFFKELIDSGATVVYGHHPHVLQKPFRYKNGLILPSMGNFISGMIVRRNLELPLHPYNHTSDGMVVRAVFVRDRRGVVLDDWEIRYLFNHREKDGLVKVIPYADFFNGKYRVPDDHFTYLYRRYGELNRQFGVESGVSAGVLPGCSLFPVFK